MVETKKTQNERYAAKIISPTRLKREYRLVSWVSLLLLVTMIVPTLYTFAQQPRVIQITADHDNRFKIAGQKQPVPSSR